MNNKIKYYIRGLGTGIVVTTLVLTISFNFGNSGKNKKSDEKISTESTTESLSQTTEKKTTKKETTKKETTKKETTKKKTTKKETTKKETTKKETTGKETTTQEQTTRETETSVQPPETEKVHFTIQSGMTSNEVAAMLKELGVVDDDNDFNMYLYNNGYESSIKVGEFEAYKGESYGELATLITGR